MNDVQRRRLYRALLLAAAACFVMLLFVVREWTAVALSLWVGGLVAAAAGFRLLHPRWRQEGRQGVARARRRDSETQGRRRRRRTV